MKNLSVPAKLEYLDEVTGFIEGMLDDCEQKTVLQIRLAAEEIFVNIVSYAYESGEGNMDIDCDFLENPKRFMLRFSDYGIPFDPTAMEDADTSEDALLGRIGGLGILLVKKNMDKVEYVREQGKNVLTLIKNL